MRRFAVLLIPVLAGGCAVHASATLPEPVVAVNVAPPPPAPEAQPAPPTQAASDEAEPIPEGDPEELTATSEPPDPLYEEPTDAPSPGYVWVGGYWGWNGVDWGWNWGRWAPPPPDGRVYIAPYYEHVGGSVVYVGGFWGPREYQRPSYGGERITFTVQPRPANYHRGEHTPVEHRAGPAPGKRPGGAYAKATGTPRAVPRNTTPVHRAVASSQNPGQSREHAQPGLKDEKREPNGNVGEHATPGLRDEHKATTANGNVGEHATPNTRDARKAEPNGNVGEHATPGLRDEHKATTTNGNIGEHATPGLREEKRSEPPVTHPAPTSHPSVTPGSTPTPHPVTPAQTQTKKKR